MENAEIAEIVEDAPAAEAPAPAPAATLEIVHERPHTLQEQEKSTENFGIPASTYSDFFTYRHYFNLD